MKLYFVMNVRFPTEKAHGWQIAKTLEALREIGADVTLVVPNRKNPIADSPETYYGLKKPLTVVRLPVIDLFPIAWIPRRLAFAVMELSFLTSVRRWSRRESSSAVVLTRDQFLAAWFQKPGWRILFEMHDVPSDFFATHRRLGARADGFVMTNAWKKEEAGRVWGASAAARSIVLPNAVDVSSFASLPSKENARQRLGWPMDQRVAVYTGHFYAWKGVNVLADAAALLPSDMRVVMVGGTTEDFAKMHTYLKEHEAQERVTLVPHVPHAEVLTYLAAADCLVLPNSGTSHERYTTSPIKLWEYLAAARPVVASDLPSIRELVSEREVRFVPPDDSAALAYAIEGASHGDSDRVAAGAELVKRHTWEARARQLLEAAKRLCCATK